MSWEDDFARWQESVPQAIRNDPLWRAEYYRLALFLYELVWDDIEHIWRDLRGKEININDYRDGDVINLGDTFSDMPEPDLDQLPSPSLPPDAKDYVDWLKDMAMMLSFTSPVTFGIDEGSQRSAETLAARALPTITSVNDYREAISDGLNRLAQLVWRALRWSEDLDFDRTAKELKNFKVIVQYAPILSKDRASLVIEETSLVGAGIRSMKKAIENLGDVYNVERERAEIMRDLEQRLQLELEYQPQPISPFGNDGSSSQNSTGANSNANGSSASRQTTNQQRSTAAKARSNGN